MRVDVVADDSGFVKSAIFADSFRSLELDVVTIDLGELGIRTCGRLKAGPGRTWAINSVGEINLVIRQAMQTVTVAELIEYLGPNDEARPPSRWQ